MRTQGSHAQIPLSHPCDHLTRDRSSSGPITGQTNPVPSDPKNTTASSAKRNLSSLVTAGIVLAAAATVAVIALSAWWLLTRRRRRSENATTTAYNPVLVRDGVPEVTSRKAKLEALDPPVPTQMQHSHAEFERLRETVAVLNSRLREMEMGTASESLPDYASLPGRPL